jgi:hypothetical protein
VISTSFLLVQTGRKNRVARRRGDETLVSFKKQWSRPMPRRGKDGKVNNAVLVLHGTGGATVTQ